MIKTLKIEGYRGFKSYEMDKLARVNLLVGQNNSGKTAILEALSFLASGGSPAELAAIAWRRGEVVRDIDEDMATPDLSHFFNGHELDEGTSFRVQGDNGYPPVGVKISLLTSKQTELFRQRGRIRPSTSRRVRVGADGTERTVEQFPAWGAMFEGTWASQEGQREALTLSPDGGIIDMYGPGLRRRIERDSSAQLEYVFVPTASITGQALARFWRRAELDSKTDRVLQAIQLTVPDATRVVVVPGGVRSDADWFLITKDRLRPVPLGSYGDGVKRLLGLALAMLGAEGGMFLIDEIDTGLHYTVMADMWKMVIGTAKNLDMQVFATTHSKDCIEGLSDCLTADPSLASEVALHQIASPPARSVAVPGDEIPALTRAHVDPR